MKTYLITGGAGFIGSNLAEELLKENKVVIIDNLSSGFLHNLPISKNVNFFNEDLTNFDLFSLKDSFDGVIHLAAQASVPLSINDFQNSSNINLMCMTNIMNFCNKKSLPFVFASSSAIYGNLENGDDTSDLTNLISPYACDKYAMELYANTSFNTFGLSSLGLRFFNVYGPKQDPSSPYSGVISIFADRIAKDMPIVINGGHQTRDFIYVYDVVLCIISALERASEEIVCDNLNILTGTSYSINYLAAEIAKIVGNNLVAEYKDLPDGDPERSEGTINKMEKILSIEANKFTPFSEGLMKTIKYIT